MHGLKFIRIKLLELNEKCSPFLVVLAFFFLFLESYLYLGFLKKFFLVDSRTFLIIALTSALIAKSFSLTKKETDNVLSLKSLVFQLNKIAFPAILIFYFIMKFSEAGNYHNYVFTTFHLSPDTFFYLVVFSGGLLVIDVVFKTQKSYPFLEWIKKAVYPNNTPLRSVSFLAAVVLLTLYTATNVTRTINTAISSDVYVFSHANDSYDLKMAQRWKNFYNYMIFIKDNTPEDATIVIPPKEAPWLESGNAGLVKGFLYPRNILNGSYEGLPKEHFDYVLLAKGRWYVDNKEKYGWPKVKVPTNEVIYFDIVTGTVEKMHGPFEPDLPKNKEAWGLIKVDTK